MDFEIVTSRLLLRPLVDRDRAAITELFADEAVRRHLALGPMGDLAAAKFAARFIRGSRDEWREGGCGALAMVPRTGAPAIVPRTGARNEVLGTGAQYMAPRAGARATTAQGTGRAIGYCGLRPLPDRISAVELLYALGPRHWGQGLAAEAAGAVLKWGFANLAVREIQAFCRPDHAASRRVLEKLGLADRGETDRYYGETLAVYGLARPEDQPLDHTNRR